MKAKSKIKSINTLTPMQEGILHHHLENEDSSSYHIQTSIWVNNKFELKNLSASVELLAQRHEELKTSIAILKSTGKAWQVNLEGRQVALKYIKRYGECPQKVEKELRENDLKHRFDLQKDSLFRLTVASLAEDKHLFLFSFHHIIVDGWSVNIIFNEFFSYLEQLESGIDEEELVNRIEEEKTNASQYSDYKKWLEKQDKDKGLAYWENLLNDYEEPAEIKPMSEPASTHEQVGNVDITLDKALTKKLNEIAYANHLTINTIMEAAWGITLQKFNNTNDVVFGKIVSGRNARIDGIEEMVGLFINAIPVRVKSEATMIVVDLLKQLQNQAMDSVNYDYCALAEVQNQTQLKSDLIKTLFVFENYYVNEDKKANKLQIEIGDTREQTNYDMSLIVYLIEERLTFKLMYHPGKYEVTEIQSILEKLVLILKEMALDVNKEIKAISMVTQEEKSLILHDFNQTAMTYDKEKTIVELFEEQVSKFPHKPALQMNDEQLSFAELNDQANQLGAKLRDLGVKANDIVTVIADRSLEMFVGIFGILKAGAAYLPLDPKYPLDRLDYVIKDSHATAIIIGPMKNQNPYLAEIDIPKIELAELAPAISPVCQLKRVNRSDDLAYIIYTSGTTGKPKGVMVEHHNVLNLVQWQSINGNYTEDTIVLQNFNYIFDGSIWEIFPAILSGCTLEIIPEDSRYDPEKLLKLIPNKQITMVPSLFKAIVDYARENKIEKQLHAFDKLYLAGEAVPYDLIECYQKMPGHNMKNLFNAYGPTETTVCATCYSFDQMPGRMLIGKPVGNTEVYILAENTLCGIGVVGELCVGGAGVTRGYLNHPELTQEKFIDHLFGKGRLYRTGDLARWMPDGNIEYIGRIDEQVKIRGFRIELGEIESTLRKITDVIDSVAIIKEDKQGEKSIHAYFIANGDLKIEVIKDELRKNLPHYMVPSHLKQIEKIPVTLNGKLDRKALPEIDTLSQATHVAPRNEMEETLIQLFKEILEIEDELGVKDNFFDLGGHSLRATRLVNRIESEIGVKIRLKEVMDNPTIETMAKMMGAKKTEEYIPIPLANNQAYYSMSSTQKRMYLLNQLDENSTTYNMPQAFKLSGDVKIACLKKAMEKLVARHEILRTTFMVIEGEFVQKVNDVTEVEFSEIEDAKTQERELLQAFIQPFDLHKGPLVRIRVIKREAVHFLFIDMHHIISDGMSRGTFINELVKLYHGDTLEALTHQYKDYSEWMRTRDLSEFRTYWVNQFEEEVPVLDMPLDYPRPPKQSFKGARIEEKIGRELAEQIKDFTKENNVTAYMFFLTTVMILLGKYSNQEDVVIGSPITGRSHRDTEKMLGMFVNTLAMRGRPEGKKTYETYLKEIKEVCLKAYENQEYPFEELIEEVITHRDMSRNPLFDVMLVVQNNEEVQLNLNGVKIEPMEIDFEVSKFDLTFSISETTEGYHLIAEYCTDLYQVSTIQHLVKYLTLVIKQVISEPTLKLEDIEVITAEEKELILSTFNDTKMTYSKEKTVVEIFEAQVKKRPDQTAVIFKDEKVTYQELNARANRVARQLRNLGVKPNDCVALMTERSIEMIVGMYAILKAGGAYVPLDPTYPKERVNYIMTDCQPKALLTNQTQVNEIDVPMIEFKQITEQDDKNLEHVNQSDDLTYLIYTSGTTGNPKGVMVEHRNLLNLVQWQKQRGNYTEKTTILQNFNYIFDGSVWEIFPTLLSGCTLEIIPEESRYDAEQLLNLIPNKQIMMVPSVFKAMVDYAEENNLEHQLHAFDKLYMGGEALSYDLIQRYQNMPGNNIKHMFNAYGPTETTVCATCYPLDQPHERMLIGKPIGNTEAYILEEDKLCGIGRIGELCIGGDGVTRGYLNRPDLTEEKFIDPPFGKGRLYRTGDLARWLPDGNIEYIGRIDDQVKIRGFRIELGEIEARLRESPLVDDVKVMINQTGEDKSLCAYVVGKDKINPRSVESELKTKLPSYMIPNHFIQVDHFPLMKNGKIDVRKLSEIKVELEEKVYVAPRTELEEIVQGIFKQVLVKEDVSIDDRFIELGGDSLKAAKVVNLIAQQTNVKIALSSIFLKGDTVEDIAKEIESSRDIDDFAQLPTFIEEII